MFDLHGESTRFAPRPSGLRAAHATLHAAIYLWHGKLRRQRDCRLIYITLATAVAAISPKQFLFADQMAKCDGPGHTECTFDIHD